MSSDTIRTDFDNIDHTGAFSKWDFDEMMRTWTATESSGDSALNQGNILAPFVENYPFDVVECLRIPEPVKYVNIGLILALVFGSIGGIIIMSILYCYVLKPRKSLPDGHEAVGPADDKVGPYTCILAQRNYKNEYDSIPGKLIKAKRAFFPYFGKEYETNKFKIVKGTVLAKGLKPAEVDAVGF